jgi:hypothetical protein
MDPLVQLKVGDGDIRGAGNGGCSAISICFAAVLWRRAPSAAGCARSTWRRRDGGHAQERYGCEARVLCGMPRRTHICAAAHTYTCACWLDVAAFSSTDDVWRAFSSTDACVLRSKRNAAVLRGGYRHATVEASPTSCCLGPAAPPLRWRTRLGFTVPRARRPFEVEAQALSTLTHFSSSICTHAMTSWPGAAAFSPTDGVPCGRGDAVASGACGAAAAALLGCKAAPQLVQARRQMMQ